MEVATGQETIDSGQSIEYDPSPPNEYCRAPHRTLQSRNDCLQSIVPCRQSQAKIDLLELDWLVTVWRYYTSCSGRRRNRSDATMTDLATAPTLTVRISHASRPSLFPAITVRTPASINVTQVGHAIQVTGWKVHDEYTLPVVDLLVRESEVEHLVFVDVADRLVFTSGHSDAPLWQGFRLLATSRRVTTVNQGGTKCPALP